MNCNKLETESNILKLSLFAFKVSVIIPEHLALCILANLVCTIQFKVLQPNFSLVRQTKQAKMYRSPIPIFGPPQVSILDEKASDVRQKQPLRSMLLSAKTISCSTFFFFNFPAANRHFLLEKLQIFHLEYL